MDHEGEVLEVFATKRRDRRAALKLGSAPPTAALPISDALVMAKHLNALLMTSGRINAAAEFFKKNS